jgi:hypothetical protein
VPARKHIPKIVILAPLSLLGVLLLAWLALIFFMRGPLSGNSRHDFGEVTIVPGQKITLTHTFHFTNPPTGKTLMINWAKPDCGCVTVEATFPRTLEPGQSFDMPITMTYGGPAPRKVLIQIDCGEAGLHKAWVQARAKS